MRDRLLANNPILNLIDSAEMDRLAKIPNGPRYLSEQAAAWAKTKTWYGDVLGWNRDLPEMLALAVRSTRYGCQRDGGHGRHSRQAFAELHKRLPENA